MKKGIFYYICGGKTKFNMKEDIVKVFKSTLEVLSNTKDIDETQLNRTLFDLICYNDIGTITERFDKYYNIQKIDDISKLQYTIRQRTNYILNCLKQYIKDISFNPEMNIIGYEGIIAMIISSRNMRFARHILYDRYRGKAKDIEVVFNFNVYREIYSVSSIYDMRQINGNITKLTTLKVLFYIHINEIIKDIYKRLELFGIIEDYPVYSIRTLEDISSHISKIIATCLNNNTKIKVVDNTDKTKMLKDFCRYEQGKNVEKLINILDELKDRFEIYPNSCNKKRFAEIVYILYRCQYYIGMKPKAIRTYKKFMKLMYSYYNYPETTYKINDIKDSAMNLMNRYSYFNDFKFDKSN